MLIPWSSTTSDVRNCPSKLGRPPHRSRWAVNSNGPWFKRPESVATNAPSLSQIPSPSTSSKVSWVWLGWSISRIRVWRTFVFSLLGPQRCGAALDVAVRSPSNLTKSASSKEPSLRRRTRRVASSAWRFVGSNLPQSSCHRLTSIWIRFASNHGSPTDRGAPILRPVSSIPPSRQTSRSSSWTERPLDRSSFAMTWERAQFVGATKTIRTQRNGGASRTPSGIINPSQQNRRCLMGIPSRSRGSCDTSRAVMANTESERRAHGTSFSAFLASEPYSETTNWARTVFRSHDRASPVQDQGDVRGGLDWRRSTMQEKRTRSRNAALAKQRLTSVEWWQAGSSSVPLSSRRVVDEHPTEANR